MPEQYNVAVIGCGLIGKRRAAEAAAHSRSRVTWVVDANLDVASEAAAGYDAQSGGSWEAIMLDPNVDIVCVATPNHLLAPITIAAVTAGKHVLLEKPMGRNLAEAQCIADAAQLAPALKVKVGFNHRYHPGIMRAREEFDLGRIGRIINIRARYGHGGRPGYEREWRGNRETAGGGELTDQGVHIADLIAWFAGIPDRAFAMLQTAIWPLGELEDNAFGLFAYDCGIVVNLHTSWTQWKNLFSFEIFGDRGSLAVEGLGKSYGIERLTIAERAMAGGAPDMYEERFDDPDDSWRSEWHQFMSAITSDRPYYGAPADALASMLMLDALYRSAQTGTMVTVK